jgi:hypothetical protein
MQFIPDIVLAVTYWHPHMHKIQLCVGRKFQHSEEIHRQFAILRRKLIQRNI